MLKFHGISEFPAHCTFIVTFLYILGFHSDKEYGIVVLYLDLAVFLNLFFRITRLFVLFCSENSRRQTEICERCSEEEDHDVQELFKGFQPFCFSLYLNDISFHFQQRSTLTKIELKVVTNN